MFNNFKIRIFLLFIFFVIIFFTINYSIGKETSFLRNIKKIIPEDIKLFLKEKVFVHKYNDFLENEIKTQKNNNFQLKLINEKLISSKVQIKSTNNSFELTEKDSIFIYQKNFINIQETSKKNYLSNNNLEIYSYNLNSKKKCLSNKNSKNYIEIKIKKLIHKCGDSIFFQGIYNKNIYFYFSLKNEPINSKNKNLLILPVATFFDYTSNINDIRLDHDVKKVNYIHFANDVPTSNNQKLEKKWPEMIHKSILNIKELYTNFNIINDYEIEKVNLDNFENIILPMHQESISINALEKLLNFLNYGINKKILSIGGANLMRKVKYLFKDNQLQAIEFTHELIDFKKNNLNTFIQMVDEEEKKKVSSKEKIECEIEKKVFNKEINLGEIMYPFYSKNTEHFFKDIKCPKLNLPMLSITKFKNGKLIYINSDGIGENLVLSEKLYNKLKNEIIN